MHKRPFAAADPEETRNWRYLRIVKAAINHFLLQVNSGKTRFFGAAAPAALLHKVFISAKKIDDFFILEAIQTGSIEYLLDDKKLNEGQQKYEQDIART